MKQAALSWAQLGGARVAVPPHVVASKLVNQTVLLDLRLGKYHGLNGVGARFFEVLSEGADLDEATVRLAAEYEQPAERIRADLATFASRLLGDGLLVVDGSEP